MRLTVAVLLGIVVSAVSVHAAGPSDMLLHEEPLPLAEITFTDESGTVLSLKAWRGKVVLLNVWATWCPPYREEMPTLDSLQALLGGDNFEVIALSIDRAGVDAVAGFFDEIGIKHLQIFIDQSGRAAGELKVFGLPATILVGPDGKELGRLVGPAEWDTPEMIALFEDVIAGNRE